MVDVNMIIIYCFFISGRATGFFVKSGGKLISNPINFMIKAQKPQTVNIIQNVISPKCRGAFIIFRKATGHQENSVLYSRQLSPYNLLFGSPIFRTELVSKFAWSFFPIICFEVATKNDVAPLCPVYKFCMVFSGNKAPFLNGRSGRWNRVVERNLAYLKTNAYLIIRVKHMNDGSAETGKRGGDFLHLT